MVYDPVPRSQIMDALVHVRSLYRRIKASSDAELRKQERREAVTSDLLSNLPRTNQHPTLKALLEIAEICSLTLEGAHRLFGYYLDEIRDYDLRLNGGRTHIIESYPFERDLLIELPARLASRDVFSTDALLRDLVPEWHTDVPIRMLEQEGWQQPGAFYVHVGTKDSLGSGIPPGSIALVEPISKEERLQPNPRAIYLLQLGNGYRCSHCVLTRGKLRLFSSELTYRGREEPIYPGAVRIAGRIRMFAMGLPAAEYDLEPLPTSRQGADLVLPWEHPTRDRLFATEFRRFKRSKGERIAIKHLLTEELQTRLSGRSERRYRRPTPSEPHVNALIHLTIAHITRYTDALRTGGSLISDKDRFSLEPLLQAGRLEDAAIHKRVPLPTPADIWEARRKEFGEWPSLLSLAFPRLRSWDDRIIRLANGANISGLDPSMGPGSWMLLEKLSTIPDTGTVPQRSGWSRPIYVLRRGLKTFCGYLERSGSQFAILSNASGGLEVGFHADELPQLSRVAGVAVPV